VKYPFQPLEEIGKGYFVTRQVIGGRFSSNFPTLAEAQEASACMNANEPEYLTEIVEQEIAKFTDFSGLACQHALAQRIAGVVIATFIGL